MEVVANQNLNYTFYLQPVDHITSIGVHSADAVKLWPNPAGDQIYFAVLQPESGMMTISISDIRGSLIMQVEINSSADNKYSLDVSDLDPGVYTFSIKTDQNQYQHKLIKN
jgi:aminopeptidase YwaD